MGSAPRKSDVSFAASAASVSLRLSISRDNADCRIHSHAQIHVREGTRKTNKYQRVCEHYTGFRLCVFSLLCRDSDKHVHVYMYVYICMCMYSYEKLCAHVNVYIHAYVYVFVLPLCCWFVVCAHRAKWRLQCLFRRQDSGCRLSASTLQHIEKHIHVIVLFLVHREK